VCESLRIAGILLQPFMPQKATELLDHIGVHPDARSARGFASAVYGADVEYGRVEKTKKRLFPPLLIED
jgi:methionyl-tRNA synthetase